LYKVKAIDILFDRDGFEHTAHVDVLWQGELHQDSMHRGVCIQGLDGADERLRIDRFLQVEPERANADLLAGAHLVADVDGGSRVVSYQEHGQTGNDVGPLAQPLDPGYELGPQQSGGSTAVDNTRAHGS
jgi:hypothetical protein